ncbi:MAG: hypothetical protein R3C12_18650 [Planctomycetaceae bacterium]
MFTGLMEKQSATLGGVWSTLQDNIGMALTEIGIGIADTFDLTAVTTNITGFVQSTIPLIKSWMEYFKGYSLNCNRSKSSSGMLW